MGGVCALLLVLRIINELRDHFNYTNVENRAIVRTDYDRHDLHFSGGAVLRGQRFVHSLLRKTLKRIMENLIVGIVALLLFAYLFVAMIRPEKF